VAQVSVANVVTSLRLCATLDWQEYVESVSLVESVLQRDPAEAYARMDFLSRDEQRQAVEELAPASGEGQVRVALKAIESARQAAAADSTTARAAHVGYHLVDRGRAELEADLAYRPSLRRRARRLLLGHASGVYLGAIAILTGCLVALAPAYARHARRRARRPDRSGVPGAAAGERVRHRVGAAGGDPPRWPEAAAAARLLRRGA
jgi:cyclic beta-1,2-glucan synthetase